MKSLVLKGFKSFADTTRLDFEPGVTVVVGPNGSGKSNLVDAIAWVLGSQSPHAIRSGKMEDVIFQGSQKRSALGRAEVSLILDNECGTIPLEFPEIVISRTLFRTGESEYAVNGSPCRLMDVADIILDGGMGKSQHTIVSQGEVDTVLNDRSEDRRLIIEEAAGVLKYKKRRQRAEKKLSDTDGDLSRLGDLIREISRQLDPLERQAEAAHKHGEMLEHLSELRLFLAGEELRGLRKKKDFLSDKHNDLKSQESGLRKEQTDLSESIKEHEAKLSVFSQDNSGEVLARLESLKARIQAALQNLQERSLKLATETQVVGEFRRTQAEKTELEQELRTVRSQLKEYKANQEELQLSLGGLENIQTQLKEVIAKLQVVESMETETTAELADYQSKYDQKAEDHTTHELQRQQSYLEEKMEEKNRWNTKLEALSSAEDFIVSMDNPYAAEILGNLVTTSPGYEKATVAALGEATKAILPSTDAYQILEGLKEKGLTGLVIKSYAAGKTPTTHQDKLLRPLVSVGTKNAKMLDDILAGVLVVEGWREALELHLETNCVVVSKDGDKFSDTGWYLGNSTSSVDTALTSAARKSSIAEAKANLTELEGLTMTAQETLKHLEEKQRNLLVARRTLEAQIKSTTQKIESIQSQKQELIDRHQELERQHQTHAGGKIEELERAKHLADIASERQKEIELTLSANNQKLLSLQEQLDSAPQENFDKLEVVEALHQHFSNLEPQIETSLNDLRQRRQAESQESQSLANELEKNRHQKDEVDGRLEDLRESVRQAEVSFVEVLAHLDNAIQNLERDLEVTVEIALKATCPKLELGKLAQDRISEIEHELQLIGPVNHLALAEYENIKARHGFLSEQIQDIKDARKELRKLIRTVDIEMANAFEAAFTDISAAFEKLFEIAFPGGEGKLSLSDSKNILETGVDISARPGEKSIKRLSLLSGGERSLVALTFLFAVIKCRPAPFCILDEVDAALDDINLCRFLDLVKELINDTQLLIISHQKRTMEAADYLYGISMPTEGISRAISEKRASVEKTVKV